MSPRASLVSETRRCRPSPRQSVEHSGGEASDDEDVLAHLGREVSVKQIEEHVRIEPSH